MYAVRRHTSEIIPKPFFWEYEILENYRNFCYGIITEFQPFSPDLLKKLYLKSRKQRLASYV
jgi:hypothetical protein